MPSSPSSMILINDALLLHDIVDYLTVKEAIAWSMTCRDIRSHLHLTVIDIAPVVTTSGQQSQITKESTTTGSINRNKEEDMNNNENVEQMYVNPSHFILQENDRGNGTRKETNQKQAQLLMRLPRNQQIVSSPMHTIQISFTLSNFPTCDGPLRELLLVREEKSSFNEKHVDGRNTANEGRDKKIICHSLTLPQLYKEGTITIQTTSSPEEHCHFMYNTYSIWGVFKDEDNTSTNINNITVGSTKTLHQKSLLSNVKIKALVYNHNILSRDKPKTSPTMNTTRRTAMQHQEQQQQQQRSEADIDSSNVAKSSTVNQTTRNIVHYNTTIRNIPLINISIKALPIEPYGYLACFGMC